MAIFGFHTRVIRQAMLSAAGEAVTPCPAKRFSGGDLHKCMGTPSPNAGLVGVVGDFFLGDGAGRGDLRLKVAPSLTMSLSFVFFCCNPKVTFGLICLLGRVDNVAGMEFGSAIFGDMDAVLFCY